MNRFPLHRLFFVLVLTLSLANSAYTDCMPGIDSERGSVGVTGKLVTWCQEGFEGAAAVYAVQPNKNSVVILGTIDEATKVALANRAPLASGNFDLLLGRTITVIAEVQGADEKSPQKVLSANVVLDGYSEALPCDDTASESRLFTGTAANESDDPAVSKAATIRDLETMPVNAFRIVQRTFVNPDDPSAEVWVYDLIPRTEAADYHPEGDDWRLHGRSPKGWTLLRIEIGEPHFRNTNFITSLGMVDAEKLWENAAVVTALDKAATKEERRKILRTNIKQ